MLRVLLHLSSGVTHGQVLTPELALLSAQATPGRSVPFVDVRGGVARLSSATAVDSGAVKVEVQPGGGWVGVDASGMAVGAGARVGGSILRARGPGSGSGAGAGVCSGSGHGEGGGSSARAAPPEVDVIELGDSDGDDFPTAPLRLLVPGGLAASAAPTTAQGPHPGGPSGATVVPIAPAPPPAGAGVSPAAPAAGTPSMVVMRPATPSAAGVGVGTGAGAGARAGAGAGPGVSPGAGQGSAAGAVGGPRPVVGQGLVRAPSSGSSAVAAGSAVRVAVEPDVVLLCSSESEAESESELWGCYLGQGRRGGATHHSTLRGPASKRARRVVSDDGTPSGPPDDAGDPPAPSAPSNAQLGAGPCVAPAPSLTSSQPSVVPQPLIAQPGSAAEAAPSQVPSVVLRAPPDGRGAAGAPSDPSAPLPPPAQGPSVVPSVSPAVRPALGRADSPSSHAGDPHQLQLQSQPQPQSLSLSQQSRGLSQTDPEVLEASRREMRQLLEDPLSLLAGIRDALNRDDGGAPARPAPAMSSSQGSTLAGSQPGLPR
jgi:hypothetical protein